MRLTCERFAGRESSVILTRPESRVEAVREWPDDVRKVERVGEWDSAPGLVSRSRLLRRSLLLRRFCRSIISSILSKRRSEEDEAEGSTGSVLMGVAGGKEQGGGGGGGNEMGASAADMERDFARPGWESTVGFVALSPSDSAALENARRELTLSAVRNCRI